MNDCFTYLRHPESGIFLMLLLVKLDDIRHEKRKAQIRGLIQETKS